MIYHVKFNNWFILNARALLRFSKLRAPKPNSLMHLSFFRMESHLGYLFIIWVPKRLSIGMEQKKKFERFETSRLSSTRTLQQSKIARVILYRHGRRNSF